MIESYVHVITDRLGQVVKFIGGDTVDESLQGVIEIDDGLAQNVLDDCYMEDNRDFSDQNVVIFFNTKVESAYNSFEGDYDVDIEHIYVKHVVLIDGYKDYWRNEIFRSGCYQEEIECWEAAYRSNWVPGTVTGRLKSTKEDDE